MGVVGMEMEMECGRDGGELWDGCVVGFGMGVWWG